MLKNWLVRAALLLGLLALTAFTCSLASLPTLFQEVTGSGTSQNTLDAAIQATIDANLQAARTNDLAGYMATIHPDSPLYASTESLMRQLFSMNYVLAYQVTLGSATLLSTGEASVPFTLTTTKVSGGAFRDNTINGTFILRLDGTQWKIYSQNIENIRYLSSTKPV